MRRWWETWNTGDVDRLASMLPHDFVVDLSRRYLEPGVHRGRDAARAELRRWHSAWEEHRVELEDLRTHGDRVLTLVRATARGSASRVPVTARVAYIWTFRDGAVVHAEYFDEHAAAAAAFEAG